MAAGATYVSIASTTLSSAQNSVTFNSFGGYTDLVLIIRTAPTSNGVNAFKLVFNNDTSSSYGMTALFGKSANTISSDRNTNEGTARWNNNSTGSNQSFYILNIMNYSNSTTYKNILGKNSTDNAGIVEFNLNTYRKTDAITSMEIYWDPTANKLVSGSTFNLYGISAA